LSDQNKKNRRPPIKPVSRDTKFVKLKACQCFDEADRRLRLGQSFTDIARFIQQDNQEYTETAEAHLVNVLTEYYESIPLIEKAMGANSPTQRKLAKQLDSGLDEVAELERVYKIQMERVENLVQQEKNMGIALKDFTGKEIWFAVKILEQSSKLKMDLGIVKRQLGQLDIGSAPAALELGERYGRESVGKVLSDPEARRRVLALAEKLITLSDKAGINDVITPEESKGDFIDVEAEEIKKEDDTE
jgi:hypothetical protein